MYINLYINGKGTKELPSLFLLANQIIKQILLIIDDKLAAGSHYLIKIEILSDWELNCWTTFKQ